MDWSNMAQQQNQNPCQAYVKSSFCTVSSYSLACLPKYISDRIMSICIRRKLNVTIIQVYALTAEASEQKIEDFYAQVQSALDRTSRKDIIYIVGDLNAKVRKGEEAGVVSRHSLGERNDVKGCLVQFCQKNKFRITNTFFTQPKECLYTCISPNGQHCNQIDYILCHQKWKGYSFSTKTLQGVDCGSDHQLLLAKVRFRLNKIKCAALQRTFNVSKIPTQYAVETRNRFDLLRKGGGGPDELWVVIKETITDIAQEDMPYKKPVHVKKPFSAHQATIKDFDGNEISDQQDIKKRWKELYTGASTDYSEKLKGQEEPESDLLESEVEWALRQLPNNKAPSINGISAELLKPVPRATLTTLCQKIWRTCTWSKDWKRSVFIALLKKGYSKDCVNYRMIALIRHASKVLLKIIQKCLGNIPSWILQGQRDP
ncbi:hypothetical protein P4O66_020352 [Electrophorus voltai]|uniref:Endonuclease/exonuclease/phosphatase domain-containing protein n=1 Tax=Electrophorus voltai TaxID=2609070 RepID=A0AAD8ZSC5_9TELE|nr:hypothetical protein P4O66_020352 [Electrophorus voltai]